MGGEGGQALLYALFIADIRENFVEEGDLAVVAGGNMETGHAHELEQADGLQCDGLAARIGTCDDDQVVVLAQFKIDGDDFLFIDQGMAAPVDLNMSAAVEGGHCRVLFQR